MKRFTLVLGAFFLIMIVLGCGFAGVTIDLGGGDGKAPSPQAENPPIEAGIDSPANGSLFKMGPVEIAYHASSTEGVSEVELSIDGAVVSAISSPDAAQKVVALKYTWNPTSPGSHTLQVRAQNKSGAWSNFATAAINIEGGQPTQQQSQEPPAVQPTNTPEPAKTLEPTATPRDMQIYDVKASKDLFYYGGGGCNRELTITANITHPDKAYAVILFTRMVDKEGEGSAGWDGGHAMSKKGDGFYSITLFSESLANCFKYDFASMHYQIKVQDKPKNGSFNILASSEVFKNVSLHVCQ